MNKTQVLISLAETYGDELTEVRLGAYRLALTDLTDAEMKKAFMRLINNPDQKKMPLPAQIKEAARPQLDSKAESIRRINLIKDAIRRCGYARANQAEAMLGREIWGDVCRLGGWQRICTEKNYNLDDPTTYAQRRDEIQGFVESDRKGFDYGNSLGAGSDKPRMGASDEPSRINPSSFIDLKRNQDEDA